MRIDLLVLVLISSLFFPALQALSAPLVFGVTPDKKPSELYVIFKPLIRYLATELHFDIEIKVGKSYIDIIEQYKTNKIDFGYLDPVSYVRAHRAAGVLPMVSIAGADEIKLHGVILVRADSMLKTVAQLRGKRFAFGDVNSAMSHYVPRYMLLMSDIKLENLIAYQYVGSDDNIALNIINNNFDAGGVRADTALKYLSSGLRVLAESPEISPPLFVMRNGLNRKLAARIKDLIKKADPEVLRGIDRGVERIRDIEDRDYDLTRNYVYVVDHRDPVK